MDIVVRAAIMFTLLFLLLRLMGKRELGQMTPFEFVAVIVMGDLTQQAVTQNDFSITGAVLAISTFAFLAVLLSWISWRFPVMQPLLEGEPRVVVRDGKVDDRALRRDRLTRAEIESEMRLAGIAHMRDVAWAILEPSGKFSFIERRPDRSEDGASVNAT